MVLKIKTYILLHGRFQSTMQMESDQIVLAPLHHRIVVEYEEVLRNEHHQLPLITDASGAQCQHLFAVVAKWFAVLVVQDGKVSIDAGKSVEAESNKAA